MAPDAIDLEYDLQFIVLHFAPSPKRKHHQA
jgi:hypothetical protein